MKKGYKFITRYEELRIDLDLKQSDVAHILNVKRNTYSKWENYINDMDLYNCNKLANFYDVSLDYLLALSNTKYRDTKSLEIDYELLSNRLLKLRKEKDLTQRELSEKLGFLQRTYAYYEEGKRIPTTLKLLVIAQFYDISIDFLVGRSDNKNIK